MSSHKYIDFAVESGIVTQAEVDKVVHWLDTCQRVGLGVRWGLDHLPAKEYDIMRKIVDGLRAMGVRLS